MNIGQRLSRLGVIMATVAICSTPQSALAQPPAYEPATTAHLLRTNLPAKGLVALWSAEKDAKDSCGSNHGQIHGGVLFSEGWVGWAFRFDGQDDYIDMGNQPELRIVDDQTIAMWIHPDSLGIRQNPLNKSYGGEGTITLEPDGKLSYYYGVAGHDGGDYQLLETGMIVAGRWTHIAVVRDLHNRKLRWFINGALKTEIDAKFARAMESAMSLYLGKGYTNHFTGLIDEVAIWNRALTDQEMAGLYDFAADGEPALGRPVEFDRIALRDGSTLLGAIENSQYEIAGQAGTFVIPAGRVAGFMPDKDDGSRLRLFLRDGQIVVGKFTTKLIELKHTDGGVSRQPVTAIRQCVYRRSHDAPVGPAEPRPVLRLDDGSRLDVEADHLKMSLQTAHGELDLRSDNVMRVVRSDQEGRHHVWFVNGSAITGRINSQQVTVPLSLGKKAVIGRDRIKSLSWPNHSAGPIPADATVIVLRDTDRILGRLTRFNALLRTRFADIQFNLEDLDTMTFDGGVCQVITRDGQTFRGDLAKPKRIHLKLADDLQLKIEVSQIDQLDHPLTAGPTANTAPDLTRQSTIVPSNE